MAVSRMRKIQILAHAGIKAELVASLRGGGVLHITEPSVASDERPDHESRKERERELQSQIGKLEYARVLLKPHAPKGKGLEALLSPKLVLDRQRLGEILESFDADRLYERCLDVEGKIRSAEAEVARKESLAQDLTHWSGLRMRLEDVSSTEHVEVALLTVEARDVESLASELAETASETELVEVSRSGSSAWIVVLFLRSDGAVVTPVLKRHSARPVDLADVSGTPEEAAERLRAEAAELKAATDRLREEVSDVARDYDRVLVVLDETVEKLAKEAVEERFGNTKETFLVEGWIRGRDEQALRTRLAAMSPAPHVQSRDPERGEKVPIDLDNPAVVKPFEFVTTLYGRPVYWEFDPTPLLAPFFIIFFGLCVSDGGYGVTLAILSFFFMRKMQPGSGGQRLMQLLFLGGIATAIVGFLTGGWFGIDPAVLPGWLRGGILINPLEEPMKMLNVVFVFGILQIFTGLAIKMVAEFKEGRWLDGILDQFVWIVFLGFLAPLGYSFILGGSVPAPLGDLAGKGAMVAGLVVVATGARKNPNPIMKVLGGVLKLYDVVGYFGDVLSYARLLALGLATGAIAIAINGVAEMAMGIPLAGPIAAVFVIIGGHLFNVAVNTLGGFVHSGRLQYLEFFSKFFQGGGSAFEPFRIEKRYSIVRK